MARRKRHLHIGFVSTRLAGTDGVSLEVEKWVQVLEEGLGHRCFFFAGELDWPEDRSHLVPEAHFKHPEILALTRDLFDDYQRSSETTGRIHRLRHHLKTHLHDFIGTFDLDILIAENALSLPVNVPLGLALTELAVETGMPILAHHHDFAWERKRFAVSAAQDFLRAAFPPTVPSVIHVVINSYGQQQLALRAGVSSTVIPNVMDFEHPPQQPDAHTWRLREALGVPRETYFILQPTRIVPRKRIELAIELVRRLELPAVLVISHASGDEGDAYARYLREYAELMGVPLLFAAELVGHRREVSEEGEIRRFSLADAYFNADLVTYPSRVEGFGNAFLEAIYYCRPLVLSAYEIFRIDIQPKGFRVLCFDEFLEDEVVEEARKLLERPAWVREMTAHNYAVARRYYSFKVLERSLAHLLNRCMGVE